MELKPEDGLPGRTSESFVIAFDENIAAEMKSGIDGNAKRLVRLRV